jgi:hypothetical protein
MKWIGVTVNRGNIRGPFIARVSVGSTSVDIPVYQQGPSSDECREHPHLTLTHLVNPHELDEGEVAVSLYSRSGNPIEAEAHAEIVNVMV